MPINIHRRYAQQSRPTRRSSPRDTKRRDGFHIHYYLLANLPEAAATAVAKVKDAELHQVARLKEAAATWRSLAVANCILNVLTNTARDFVQFSKPNWPLFDIA
jgi:hypothetical protein